MNTNGAVRWIVAIGLLATMIALLVGLGPRSATAPDADDSRSSAQAPSDPPETSTEGSGEAIPNPTLAAEYLAELRVYRREVRDLQLASDDTTYDCYDAQRTRILGAIHALEDYQDDPPRRFNEVTGREFLSARATEGREAYRLALDCGQGQ